MIILDSSAILALLMAESGQEVVQDALLEDTAMSAINAMETLHKYRSLKPQKPITVDELIGEGLRILPFSVAQVEAGYKIDAAGVSLSLADRACLATAIVANCPVLTADKAWQQLKLPIEVQLIR